MRWFRDTGRNDIQADLPGWPEGPVYTARSTGDKLARNIGKVGWRALYVVVMGALTSGGGSVGGSPGMLGSSEDRADEVEDFPVMWAAPGSIARTLPWQLDPARSSQEHYRTHAIVTDRRLVIVGLPYAKNSQSVEDEVLWETGRSNILRVSPRDFSHECDVKVVFADGSWCRLHTNWRDQFLRHLVNPVDLVPPESLSAAQRHTVEMFVARADAPDVGTPVVTRRPSGHYLIEVPVPSELEAFSGASYREMVMGPDGAEVAPNAVHPDDF